MLHHWRVDGAVTPIMSTVALEADFDLAIARYGAADEAFRASRSRSHSDDITHAAIDAFDLVTRIAAIPTRTEADLRVKAKALAHLFNAVPESRPTGTEQRLLCQQIIISIAAGIGVQSKSE